MSTSRQDFIEFSRFTRLEIVKSQGFRERSNALQTDLLQKWDDIVDKQEYLRWIRRYEQREVETASIRKENDTSMQRDGRMVRRAQSRATAVSLKSSYLSLERLQRVQKKRNSRGQTATFAAIIRYHDRLIEESKHEISQSKKLSVQEALDEMRTSFPNMPDDLEDYIVTTYRQLPWEDIQDDDVTDRETTVQLRNDILASQDYNDFHTLDWAAKASITDNLLSFRSAGRVRCGGHLYHERDPLAEPFLRYDVSNEWKEYLLAFTNIRSRDRPVPCWTIQAAKTRAEMLWDHTGVLVYPPEPDHSDLDFTLDQLLKAEDKYYQDRRTKLWHVRIQYAVAEHLNEMTERPARVPDRDPTSRPLNNETVKMLTTGRRALQHSWESTLWDMVQMEKKSAAEVRATYALYQKALKAFDANPLTTQKERRWLSPEYEVLSTRL